MHVGVVHLAAEVPHNVTSFTNDFLLRSRDQFGGDRSSGYRNKQQRQVTSPPSVVRETPEHTFFPLGRSAFSLSFRFALTNCTSFQKAQRNFSFFWKRRLRLTFLLHVSPVGRLSSVFTKTCDGRKTWPGSPSNIEKA